MLEKIKYFIRSVILPDRLFLVSKSKRDKAIYLTFDDGPVPGVTDELLALLKKHDAKATFFLLGKCAKEQSELLSNIFEDGHTVANHSFSHANFTRLSKEQQETEILKTNEIIENSTNFPCKLFRAPQGRWNIQLLRVLMRKKMKAVHWNRDSMDFKKESPEKLVKRFTTQPVKAGDIILFHDDDNRCIKALESLVPLWQSQGFKLKALENKL